MALQEAIDVQERFSAKLDELEKENSFLTETIVVNKLGLVTIERRKIIAEMMKLEIRNLFLKALIMQSQERIYGDINTWEEKRT